MPKVLKKNKHILYIWGGFILYLVVLYPFLRGNWTLPDTIKFIVLNVRLYSLFILLGIILAGVLVDKFAFGEKGMKNLKVDEALIWMIIPGIVLARAWHVITDFHLYQSSLVEIFYIWNGGLGIFGGMIGGAIGAYVYAKKAKINFLKGLELTAIFFPIAHAIGRLGNFANQELYGGKTDLPWGQFIQKTGNFHHPAFLYEQIGNLILLSILFTIYKKLGIKGDGRYIFIYLLGYGIIRFGVDFFRQEPHRFGELTVAQGVSLCLIIVNSIILVKLWKK